MLLYFQDYKVVEATGILGMSRRFPITANDSSIFTKRTSTILIRTLTISKAVAPPYLIYYSTANTRTNLKLHDYHMYLHLSADEATS
jgi:hypothetical protein